MKKERRTYSEEFKQEAVALVMEHGCSYATANRSLGVRGNLIGRGSASWETTRRRRFRV